MNGRVLIIGGDSLLAGSLISLWRTQGVEVLSTTRKPERVRTGVSLFNLESDFRFFQVPHPCSVAILCAGIIKLDLCRRNPEATRHIKVEQTACLAVALVAAGCFVVFLSTNLVFDGSRPQRCPDEPTGPCTELGRPKAEAEARLTSLGPRVGIVRSAKIIHSEMPLIRGWIQSLGAGEPISPFADMVCAPIKLADATHAIANVAEKQLGGIWQLSAATDVSYAGFARQVAGQLNADQHHVRPVSARDVATPEHVPHIRPLTQAGRSGNLAFKFPIRPVALRKHLFHDIRRKRIEPSHRN